MTGEDDRRRYFYSHKMSVAYRDLIVEAFAQPAAVFTEAASSFHVALSHSVHSDVVRIEVVEGINEDGLGGNLPSILKCDDANLADAAHLRIGCFKADGHDS
jgi:hypothetical protein